MIASRPAPTRVVWAWNRLCQDATLLAPLLIAGVLGVYVKHVQMMLPSGFLVISRFIGRQNVSDLNILERLSFYASDITLELVIIPVCLVLLVRSMSQRFRLTVVIVTAASLCVVHFVSLLSLGNVGRHMNLDMLTDAARWALNDPGIVPHYVSAKSLARLAVLLGMVVATAWLSVYGRSARMFRAPARMMGALSLATSTGSGILAIGGTLSPIARLPHHSSALIASIGALRTPALSSIAVPGGTTSQLLDRFRDIARSPAPAAEPAMFGLERGKNLLMFVFETGPQRSMDFVSEGRTLTGASQLIDRAYVSSRHYTTYPYTSDATFSLLTGLYPLGRAQFLKDVGEARPIGLLNALRRQGYATPVYSPIPDTFDDDAKMFEAVGASRRLIAPGTDSRTIARAEQRATNLIASLPEPARRRGAGLHTRLRNDFIVLEWLKRDIADFSGRHERFAAVITPEIGHAPWFDLYNDSSVVARGRRLMTLQDGWLAEILEVLKRLDLLDETVILVTADHGIRTMVEDPAFEAGQISDYSFNVPLLLYAPAAVHATTPLLGLTSHVDLAPTLLTLLGIPGASQYPSQGVPLWDAARTRRRIFFFAQGYLGTDGYSDQDEYVTYQPKADVVSTRATMAFGAHSRVVTDPAVAERLRRPLQEMEALQPRILESLLGNGLGGRW